jgi:branched-chain amino acid transport system permease protein
LGSLARFALFAALAAAPLAGSEYLLSLLGFVAAYAIAGLGLVILAGHGGQISLGQAAFLGVGAYAAAILARHGVPLPAGLAAAMLGAGAAGWLASLPARRLSGLYLAMATLAFGFLLEEALTRWESLTGGARGLLVPALSLGGALSGSRAGYVLAVLLFAVAAFATARLLDSRLGRSFRAIRDDEQAAEAAGVDAWRSKRTAFVASAAVTGLAGALLAHQLGVVTPEQFGIHASIELLMLTFIGGAQRPAGALFGAAFLVFVPEAIVVLRGLLPEELARQPGLQPFVFGLAVVLFVLFAPRGIVGWLPRAWLREGR